MRKQIFSGKMLRLLKPVEKSHGYYLNLCILTPRNGWSVRQYVCSSVRPFVCSSIHSFFRPTVLPSFRSNVRPSVLPFVRLSVTKKHWVKLNLQLLGSYLSTSNKTVKFNNSL